MRVIDLKGSYDGVATVAFSPDGSTLFATTWPHLLRLVRHHERLPPHCCRLRRCADLPPTHERPAFHLGRLSAFSSADGRFVAEWASRPW